MKASFFAANDMTSKGSAKTGQNGADWAYLPRISPKSVPQFQPRRPLCIFIRKSTRLPDSGRFLEIMLGLLADLLIPFGMAHQSAEAMGKLAPEGHG
jgi:hypothetical protein